jgi:hypothetical protein
MEGARNPWQDENAYVTYLEHERHLFAWCLRIVGGKSQSDAQRAAETFYTYEPATDAMRGLVFHDEAWHWAMLQIAGPQYWLARPELEQPSPAYRREAEALSSGAT